MVSAQSRSKGCLETCGSPFGGRCIAAEYIKLGGLEAYQQFKKKLLDEINVLLAAQEIGAIDGLFELVGEYVNLEYPMPSGEFSSVGLGVMMIVLSLFCRYGAEQRVEKLDACHE